MRPLDNTDWSALELNCDHAEAQEAIGLAIREGTIRVIPAPNGRIRIIPLSPSPSSAQIVGTPLPRPGDVACPLPEAPPRRVRPSLAPIRRAPGTAVSGPRR